MLLQFLGWLSVIWQVLRKILPFLLLLLLVLWVIGLRQRMDPVSLLVAAVLAVLAGRSLGRLRR